MGFILAILLSWPFFIGLALVILLLEHNEQNGWTMLFTAILATIAFFMFSLTFTQIGILAAVWLPIGFVWSFFRWKRRCDHVVEYVRNGEMMESTALRKVDAKQNVTTITHWIIAWPFSFIESIVGDIIDTIQSMIMRIMKNTYMKISANAIRDIEQYSK